MRVLICLFVVLAGCTTHTQLGNTQESSFTPSPDLFKLQGPSVRVPDFRNVRWGMTVKEVREKETASLVGETTELGTPVLYYVDELMDRRVNIFYHFTALGRLATAQYWFWTESSTAAESHFITSKSLLLSKYGYPSEELKENDDSIMWLNQRTGITLALYKKQDIPSVYIGYFSLIYGVEMKRDRARNAQL